MTIKEFLNQRVNPFWAYTLILATAVIAGFFLYKAGQGYYADQTAMYNSQGEAARLERQLTIQKRIGAGISTTSPENK